MSALESSLAVPLGAAEPRPRDDRAPGLPVRDPSATRVMGPAVRPSLGALFGEIVAHRDLMFQLAGRDVRIRYKQAVMGFAWAILMPLLVVGAGTLVRVAVVTMSGKTLDRAEIGAVALKSFPWSFFSGAIGFGVASVTSNINLVTKIYFPRAVLPIAVVASNVFDLGVGALTLLIALPFLGAHVSAALLWVPVMAALLVLLTAGLVTVLACANLFYRDVKYITQVVITFGIFFTPVLFDATAFGARIGRVLMLNPLAPIFEGLRLAVFNRHNLLLPLTETVRGVTLTVWQPWYLLYVLAWAVGSMAFGLWLFQRTQDLFAEFA